MKIVVIGATGHVGGYLIPDSSPPATRSSL